MREFDTCTTLTKIARPRADTTANGRGKNEQTKEAEEYANGLTSGKGTLGSTSFFLSFFR